MIAFALVSSAMKSFAAAWAIGGFMSTWSD